MMACLGKNLEMDFMITRNKLLLILTVLFASCGSDPIVTYIPYVYVEEEVNLNDFESLALANVGGFIYIEGGVKGIVVLHSTVSEYLAFERNCTFQPQDECAVISMHSSALYFEDTCCNSSFNLSGWPTGGPAELQLKQYSVFQDGERLLIRN